MPSLPDFTFFLIFIQIYIAEAKQRSVDWQRMIIPKLISMHDCLLSVDLLLRVQSVAPANLKWHQIYK